MKRIRSVRVTSPYFTNTSTLVASVQKPVNDSSRTREIPDPSFSLETSSPPPAPLGSAFYDQPVHSLAKALLGKILVRQLDDGKRLTGRIVETESYSGSDDQASHTFRGKTQRNAAMFEKAGTAYVYLIYGVYHCLNISALEPGAGVLIRALQPTNGIDVIRTLRKGGATSKLTDLCNGPGRLCQAFGITTPVFNGHDLHVGQKLWLEEDPLAQNIVVVSSKRVGINPKSCGETSVARPWRFYVLGCPDVSKRDKASEASLTQQTEEETRPTSAAVGGAIRGERKKRRSAQGSGSKPVESVVTGV